jgi:L-cysteine:1D-myo-inositol 2-amino-2-deoxy-alpha-D-glucopyranoside ligase
LARAWRGLAGHKPLDGRPVTARMPRFGTRDTLASMDTWPRAEVPQLPGSGQVPLVRDTATGELIPAAAGPVATVYACGITPYDATHIGHAATYTAWDLLVRALLDARRDVVYAQNVTDVDDPLLERADRDGEDWRQLALRETERYRDDMAALRVLPPNWLIGAVEAMPIIERLNARLDERGALYCVEDDVYFAKSADPAFGSLSGPGTASGYGPGVMASLAAERGGDPGRPGKKDPLDVLVWRAERPGEPAWESRFGSGRPGWHVECSAIAAEFLGIAFDVQAGGSDLVFPHHEMSASHARVGFGPAERVFARVYVHAGMVSYQGQKMSKSLGNLVFVNRLLADGVDPMAIRLALLAHHYRSDWDWTDDVLAEAAARLNRWRLAVALPAGGGRPGDSRATGGSGAGGAGAAAGAGAGETVLAEVRAAMQEDLNAPLALAAVDRWAASDPASDTSGADLVRQAVDALLGVSL